MFTTRSNNISACNSMSDLGKLEEGGRTWARDLDRHLAKERPGHLESLGQRGRLQDFSPPNSSSQSFGAGQVGGAHRPALILTLLTPGNQGKKPCHDRTVRQNCPLRKTKTSPGNWESCPCYNSLLLSVGWT